MPKLAEVLPDLNNLLSMAPEDLGVVLLKLAASNRSVNFTTSEWGMSVLSAHQPMDMNKRRAVHRAIEEAMQWLRNEGLVMKDPEQPNGYFCLTRKSEALRETGDFESYRKANLLPVSILHPKLAKKVRPMYLRGDYDVAVFQAFKEVEVSVRGGGGFPVALVGVALMREAFHPEKGPLTDGGAVYSEREAMMHLFASAIGHAKNPPSHRNVEYEHVSAAQLIGFASYLLGQVEALVVLRTATGAGGNASNQKAGER